MKPIYYIVQRSTQIVSLIVIYSSIFSLFPEKLG